MPIERNTLPLVAVVTPALNGAPYIERTLACVQAQTYPNIVHVVLDNASTDATPHLIEAAKDGGTRFLTRRNCSVLAQADNWNAAFAMVPSDATYVKLLCADDLMRPDCIEKMVSAAESDPEVDYVYAAAVVGDEIKPHGLDTLIYTGQEFGGKLLRGDAMYVQACHMFFRMTPGRLKNPFNGEMFPVMDIEYIFRELLGKKMAFIAEPLLFTRTHEDTVTNNAGGPKILSMGYHKILTMYGNIFLEKNEYESLIKKSYYHILRKIVRWNVSGDSKNAAIARELISKLHSSPTVLDYINCLATWPKFKIEHLMKQTIAIPITISEERFFSGRS